VASFAGNEFERLFGVYRVLVSLEALRKGTTRRLALQLRDCHVDDWVEDEPGARRHYQLRRRARQSWNDVRDAFQSQLRASVRGKALTVTWVVAKKGQASLLRTSVGRVEGAKVEHFPGWLRPECHIAGGPSRGALVSACVVPRPTRSDLEAIWKDVAFAWESVRCPGRFVSIKAVLERCDDQSQAPLRYSWTPPSWWTRAEQRLRGLRDFGFRLEDGHFFYSTTTGIQGRFSCRSEAFRQFANNVVTHRPRNLADVLELL